MLWTALKQQQKPHIAITSIYISKKNDMSSAMWVFHMVIHFLETYLEVQTKDVISTKLFVSEFF